SESESWRPRVGMRHNRAILGAPFPLDRPSSEGALSIERGAHPSRPLLSAFNVLFGGREPTDRRPVQHPPLDIEARAMARTVPRAFRLVPIDDAAQVRADR